jgi:hypothetical protein
MAVVVVLRSSRTLPNVTSSPAHTRHPFAAIVLSVYLFLERYGVSMCVPVSYFDRDKLCDVMGRQVRINKNFAPDAIFAASDWLLEKR